MRNGYLSNRRYLAFGAVRLMDGGGRILGVHHDFYVAVTVLQGSSRLRIPHGNAAREVHVPAVLLIQFLDCFNLVDGALVCRVGQLNRLICIVAILERGDLSTVVGTQRLVGALEGRFFTVRNGLEGLGTFFAGEESVAGWYSPMYSPVSFRGPGYFSQPSTSASSDTGTRAALDELLLALADAVAEADCEAGGELDAEAEALAEGVAVGEPILAFASSLSGRISEAQPAMRETAPPSSRVRRLIRREAAERVLEEGESIGELLELSRGRLGAPGGGRVVVWRVG